jgi:hypothetical protein
MGARNIVRNIRNGYKMLEGPVVGSCEHRNELSGT